MKRYFKIFGWIFLGILLQAKLDILYGIVALENLSFHPRGYSIKMNLTAAEENVRVLRVETTVQYSLGPDYFATVYIPNEFKVLNKTPNSGAEPIKGYQAYQMDMRRKYRHVLSLMDFLIVPANSENIEPTPIIVHFENMKQRLHSDKTYRISAASKNARLEGPPEIEAKYPQHMGM